MHAAAQLSDTEHVPQEHLCTSAPISSPLYQGQAQGFNASYKQKMNPARAAQLTGLPKHVLTGEKRAWITYKCASLPLSFCRSFLMSSLHFSLYFLLLRMPVPCWENQKYQYLFFLKPVVCIPVLRVPTGDSLGWQAGGCCAANSPSEKINSVQFLWPIIASAPVHERRSDILPKCSSGNLIKLYLTRTWQPPAYSSACKKVGSQ